MSNKTQLQTNNTQLASLIQTLQDKAAGGSGGGSVETCTININVQSGGSAQKYFASTGIIGISYINEFGELSILENQGEMKTSWSGSIVCRCGTPLSVSLSIFTYISSVSTNNTEIQYTMSSNSNRSMVTCLLPDSTGTYTIDIYY
jgi:hypothetical protein